MTRYVDLMLLVISLLTLSMKEGLHSPPGLSKNLVKPWLNNCLIISKNDYYEDLIVVGGQY